MKKSIAMALAAVSTFIVCSCGAGTMGLTQTAAPAQPVTPQPQQQQTGMGGLLSGLSGTTIGNILSSALGITLTDIVGTWVYQEPAVLFESDNFLTKAGGQIAAQNMSNKMDTYFQKVGISKGKMTMTFDKAGNFTQTIGNKVQQGTYTVENGNVNLVYTGGTKQLIGTTQFDGNNLVIVVDMTKLMNLAQTFAAASNNATLNTISSLASGVSGMKAGLKFSKK